MSENKARLPFPGEGNTLIYEGALGGAISQQATTLGLSAFFWGVWLALWAPLLTYLLWLVAPWWGFEKVSGASDQSIPVLTLLTATGFALGALLVLGGALQWAFGAARARPAVTPSVTVGDLAVTHGLQEDDLRNSWKARRLTIYHNSDSSISRIEAD